MARSITREQVVEAVVHLLVWTAFVFFLNSSRFRWEWQFYSSEEGTLLIASCYGSVFNALVFYTNALYLYPKKVSKQLIGSYAVWVLLLILSASFLESIIDYYYAHAVGAITGELTELAAPSLIAGITVQNIPFHVIYWLLSFIYYRYREGRQTHRQSIELERELLNTELKYLKAQINPHFLFNGINSVYHLIDDRPEQAKETLLTFSELLRYQLYECNELFIPLIKELTYLTNYLALEEVRKGDDATIRWEVQNYDEEAKIAPMLLQPFIENAFKHLSHHDNPAQNCLDVSLTVDQQMLSLKVENTTEVTEKTGVRTTESKGVGLENVKRRLNLIYPGRHQLLISQPPGRFQVHIMITLQHEQD